MRIKCGLVSILLMTAVGTGCAKTDSYEEDKRDVTFSNCVDAEISSRKNRVRAMYNFDGKLKDGTEIKTKFPLNWVSLGRNFMDYWELIALDENEGEIRYKLDYHPNPTPLSMKKETNKSGWVPLDKNGRNYLNRYLKEIKEINKPYWR